MEVEFKKDLRHSYMVIAKDDSLRAPEYCTGILAHQTIEGILPMEQRCFDNQVFYYYEITAKQTMINVLERTSLTGTTLRKFIQGLLEVLEEAYEYLLPEEDLILLPEFIYLDIIKYQPYLCYLPGSAHNLKKQLNILMEYLMNRIDYTDKDAVLLAYRLYAVSREEDFTFDQLTQVLQSDLQPEIKEQTAGKRGSRLAAKPDLSEQEEGQFLHSKGQVEEKQEPIKKFTALYGDSGDADLIRNYPVMNERIESETEVLYYPVQTLILAGICILIGILITILSLTTGILYNSFGNKLDYSKLLAMGLIILCAESYALKKLFNKKNKISKVVRACEYIDPRKNFGLRGIGLRWKLKARITDDLGEAKEKVQAAKHVINSEGVHYSENEADNELRKLIKHQEEMPDEEDCNPTCLLSALPVKNPYITLKAIDNSKVKDIQVPEFPFFIGKLHNNMNYCLEKEVISRYHAKITHEGDQYFIFDLNSMNGTFVNGEALLPYQKKEIKAGDEIALADIKYLLA